MIEITRAVLTALLLLIPIGGASAETDGDAILGCWATEPDDVEGNANVWVARDEDGTIDGSIVSLEIPIYPADDEQGMGGRAKIDRENPDPALRERPVVGLALVSDFRIGKGGRWEGGRIYDPNNGKTYKCWAELLEDGRLKIRGYVGISLIGRTTYWRPLADEECRIEDGSPVASDP